MSIRRSTILLVLAGLLLGGSGQLSMTYARGGERSASDDRADNISSLNDRSASKIIDTGLWIEARKIPAGSDRRETTDHQGNNGGKSVSSARNYGDMIAALSKIAKVRSAESYPLIVGRGLTQPNVYNAIRSRSTYLPSDLAQNPGGPTLYNASFERKTPDDIFRSIDGESSSEIERGNFRCRSIRGDYVTKIVEKLPPYAYACRSRNREFILTSLRFATDRRDSFDVNVDDDTLRKLNGPSEGDRYKIVPATLVLKPPYQNYVIRDRVETSSEHSAASDKKH